MLITKSYTDDTRDAVIASMPEATLVEDKRTFQGNFLIFEDGTVLSPSLEERIAVIEQRLPEIDELKKKIAVIEGKPIEVEKAF